MAPDAPRRRRARPVADAPIDGPLIRSEEIAREWLFGLLSERPLAHAREVLTESFAEAAPELCGTLLRALVTDAALAELEPGGRLRVVAGRTGELVGESSPGPASRAVDALQDVLWRALARELRGVDVDLTVELAPRLALVCAVVREAVFDSVRERGVGVDSQAEVEDQALVDRGAESPSAPMAPPVTAVSRPTAAAPPPPAARAVDPGASRLWQDALTVEVRRARMAGVPLALLLVELEDSDRLAASVAPGQAETAYAEFANALRRALRPQDVLVYESDARAWVIARETARAGAHSLAAALAEAVGETPAVGGAPPVASVGVSVLGEDGDRPSELIDAAEEARFAASARGVEVARRIPDAERGADWPHR